MRRAVLVNGVPATGKTSVARAIGARLGLPVLSLDTIKEALFEELGTGDGDREYGRALGRASMLAIWSTVAEFPPDAAVVVEAWFRKPPHDVVLRGLARAGIERWVEVWCHASPDVLAARYAARTRHPGHPPASYADELAELALVVQPMGIGDVLSVDTTDFASVDLDAVASWVREHLGLRQAGG
jgi:glucokinase